MFQTPSKATKGKGLTAPRPRAETPVPHKGHILLSHCSLCARYQYSPLLPRQRSPLTFSTCSRLSSLLCRPWLLRRAKSLSCVTPRSWSLSSAFSHSTWRGGSGRELGVCVSLVPPAPSPGRTVPFLLQPRSRCGGDSPLPGTRALAGSQATQHLRGVATWSFSVALPLSREFSSTRRAFSFWASLSCNS